MKLLTKKSLADKQAYLNIMALEMQKLAFQGFKDTNIYQLYSAMHRELDAQIAEMK